MSKKHEKHLTLASSYEPFSIEENTLQKTISRSQDYLLDLQSSDGWWWFTLEANETIDAGYIQLMHFMGAVDKNTQKGLAARILSLQQPDGSWPLFYKGAGDLSTTVECYLSLRLAGFDTNEPALERAREFILINGGLTQVRMFSRIHLALLGLVSWDICPAMPIWFMLLPAKSGVSIYEFSSWARASIVPLLILGDLKATQKVSFNLDELYVEPPTKRKFDFVKSNGFFNRTNLLVEVNRALKLLGKLPWHPGKKIAHRVAEEWIREHIEHTEDIYPAMAYSVMALHAMGYPNSDPTISKALSGLKRFQQRYPNDLPPSLIKKGKLTVDTKSEFVHQQCCISPHWDTPWTTCALVESGLPTSHPALLKSARYLMEQEVTEYRGDWRFKNPKGVASGWGFEFQNDSFPDIDDTIQALQFLIQVDLPTKEKQGTLLRAVSWVLSMQSQNGGWAAFDKDNLSEWVNDIPFSDHGACLDPPTADITGRVIETLSLFGYRKDNPIVRSALAFIYENQERFGAWRGRWGVNFIYGTWCVLQGLAAVGENMKALPAQRALAWLKSVQNEDGGWGESCQSDLDHRYTPLAESTASQTAWAIMGLIAAGEAHSTHVSRGVQWLIDHQNAEGGWDENYFTGTGFPGHFYIRYHGYAQYFPLLALAKYQKACER
ncbi:MAG: squalene--hopene cyclase [Deltaproteobacteria bacterium]|nr:MAG: squalene--hopene cyclase [Deltaproteobacteria bacterium]